MPDREKVIKGLERCLICSTSVIASAEEKKAYRDCEYNIGLYCEQDKLLRDTLSMLKEQEAVEPTLIREGRNKNYNDYVCPRCDNEVVYEQNYCSECGVRFLWEGREVE